MVISSPASLPTVVISLTGAAPHSAGRSRSQSHRVILDVRWSCATDRRGGWKPLTAGSLSRKRLIRGWGSIAHGSLKNGKLRWPAQA